MVSDQKSTRIGSSGQVVGVMLLIVGLYFPTSTNGEHSLLCVLVAFAILLSLFGYLTWNFGTRFGAAVSISLPMIIVLLGCTFSLLFNGPFQFDWGMFTKFSALALLLALDLRKFNAGTWVKAAFVLANSINIAFGFAILIGSEWVSGFLSRYYWSFYPELLPEMLRLHKPVLTLGTHASAGLFLYLFFWVNWEAYKVSRSLLAFAFAFSHVVLLVGLSSFSSLGFGLLALTQMGAWLWKHERKLLTTTALCGMVLFAIVLRQFSNEIDVLRNSPELGTKVLNSNISGPLARYGPGGSSRKAIDYLIDHPLSPIGFGTPPYLAGGSTALGDSGPLEYLLRGSLPLLALMYFGLYRFLRFNLTSRHHALLLFLVIVAFETGFSLLIYVRTLYLLPFLVVFLRHIESVQTTQRALAGAPLMPSVLGQRGVRAEGQI